MTVDITLRFEDEEHAQDFAKFMCEKEKWNVGHILMVQPNTYPDAGYDIAATVVNIQKMPPSYCTCPFQKGKSYTRGSTYGWWVCPRCNKMDEHAFNNFHILGPGISLLPIGLRPSNRGPECNEVSPKEWSFLVQDKET